MDSGILLLNKCDNTSSNKVINNIKYSLNKQGKVVKKIGHAGTLDPNATGLLVVLVNDATKISDYLLLEDKEYVAKILIGRSYDTLDIWGTLEEEKVLDEKDLFFIKEKIDNILDGLVGKNYQVPPMYSSIKINGKKLYEMARKNIKVDLSSKVREIEIFSIKRISEPVLENGIVVFEISCKVSKGTYIRSLSKSIGDLLGYPSCMAGLIRTASGEFKIEKSSTFEEINVGKYQLINMVDCLKNITKIEADEKMYSDCINGRSIKLNSSENIVAITYNNNLLAIYEKENNYYKAKRVWN